MIAADTSTWIAFLQGDSGPDVALLDQALQDRQVLMLPVVLTGVMSDPKLPSAVAKMLSALPLVDPRARLLGERAGELRASLEEGPKSTARGRVDRPSCVDQGIPLVTGDSLFSGLRQRRESKLAREVG